MTDSDSEPLDHLDDLASALLDGEVDRATATGDLDDSTRAELDERIGELTRLRDRVAELPEPPGEEIRARMIAQAISEGTPVVATPAPDPAQAPVRSLDRARARRTARLRRLAPVAVAAAVLLLGAIVLPSVLDRGDENLASSFDDEGADGADTAGGEADAATAPASDSPAVNALGDETEAMEEGGVDLEAAAEPESGDGLGDPATATATEPSETLVYEATTDDELLDAVIRFRSSVEPVDPPSGFESLQATCGDVVRHPADLIVDGSYGAEPALFVVDVDGSAVLAVTVLTPDCEILAQVSSN